MKGANIWVEVDLDQMQENLRLIKEQARPAKVCCVIKANAYGHGSVRVAKALQKEADYFAVANMNEAVELIEQGITAPILCMGYVDPSQYDRMTKYDVEIPMYDVEQAKQLSETMVNAGKVCKIHIKVDTAMRRLGFQTTDENVDKVEEISKLPGLKITGIFTHFACADADDMSFTEKQYDDYKAFVKKVEARGIDLGIHHVANSASIIDGHYKHDMVRAGIILYGSDPRGVRTTVLSKHALRMYARVSSVRTIQEGDGVSYGQTWTADCETKIATVTCGYADGYFRSLSNMGYVIIHGKPAPVRGRVCMDQMMVDITGREDVKAGDIVTIYDEDYEETNVDLIAEKIGTISYEIFCAINRRVVRAYVQQGEIVAADNYLQWNMRD